MFNGKKILDFLTELENNNCRDWFHDHKQERLEALSEFKMLVQILIDQIQVFDPLVTGLNPDHLIFRLNRDTRFAKNLPPYKTTFSAHISPAGRFPIPAGYFVCIQPGQSFIGGGAFTAPFPKAVSLVRDYLVDHSEEFLNMIESPQFSNHFELLGEKLKQVPRGYDRNHPLAEYLRHKAWDIEYSISDQKLMSPVLLIEEMTEQFRRMKAFNEFFNKALVDFQRPVGKR